MSKELISQIESSLSLSVCTGWDRGFLESILSQLARGRQLSTKQNEMIGKVLARNTLEQQQVHESWKDVYRKEYSEDARVLANYYVRGPYYQDMSRAILDNEVPERTRFMRMLENKFAKKVLAEYKAPPHYGFDAVVTGRSGLDIHGVDFGTPSAQRTGSISYVDRKASVQKFMKRGGLIVGIDDKIYSCAKGAKRYRVLPIGSSFAFFVEERHIKIKRK